MKKTILLAAFAAVAATFSLTSCGSTSESWYYVEDPVSCAVQVDGAENIADCTQCTTRLETYNAYYNYCMD